MSTEIPTLAEHTANMERTAIARRLCKNPSRFPTSREIEKEQSLAFHEATHGAKRGPLPTRAEAAAWLTSKGLSVPAIEKKEERGPL